MKYTFTIDTDTIKHNTLRCLQITACWGLAMSSLMIGIDDTNISGTPWAFLCLVITTIFVFVGVWSLIEWRDES